MLNIFWAKFESSGDGERCEDGKKRYFQPRNITLFFYQIET